jgi:hypothetical protein
VKQWNGNHGNQKKKSFAMLFVPEEQNNSPNEEEIDQPKLLEVRQKNHEYSAQVK